MRVFELTVLYYYRSLFFRYFTALFTLLFESRKPNVSGGASESINESQFIGKEMGKRTLHLNTKRELYSVRAVLTVKFNSNFKPLDG